MKINLEFETIENNYYKKVISTTQDLQVVLMSLHPNEEIGMEIHPNTTQVIYIEEGSGRAIVNNRRHNLSVGDALVIPPNTKHNIIASRYGLKLYTIYSPPHYSSKYHERVKR